MERAKGQNGKGSACRTPTDEQYRKEYDRIFSNPKKEDKPSETILRKLIQGPRNVKSNRE